MSAAAHDTASHTATHFYGEHPLVRLSRLALRAAQPLAPALAVRLAYRLFATPLPPRWIQRRLPREPGWRTERWPFEEAELTLHVPPAGPQAPLALLVHGWGGHAGQMLPLARALAARGLIPVLLEMPAHGESRGSVSNLPQFVRAIEYVVGRLAQRGHVLGLLAAHSLGANAAAFAAARGLPVHRLVLLAPPASPRAFTRYFAQVFGLSEPTRLAMQKRIESREGLLMHELEPDFTGPRIRVPTLVVHDRSDRVNPFADGQAFASRIAGARLLDTVGLGHRGLLKDEPVLDAVAAFAAEALPAAVTARA